MLIFIPPRQKFQSRTLHLKPPRGQAERGVKRMEVYNKILSRSEDEKQFIVQIVSEYIKKYPDSRKSTLAVDL